MEFKLQLFFVLTSICTLAFVLLQIRKYDLNIDDSINWILWSGLLLILSIFPGLSDWVAKMLGFMSTSNFVLCLFIFFLYLMVFAQMVQISRLKEKQKSLIQKLSLREASKHGREREEN